MALIVFLITTYLYASIPFGLLISRLRGVDIRKVGSGNIGATNVSRALGIWYAIPVGLLDFTKGLLPVLLASLFLHTQVSVALVAAVALLGHIFPLYLKFKGGKGAATYAGTMSVILGLPLFILLLLLWIVGLYATKLMSLVNLILSGIVIIIVILATHSLVFTCYALFAALVIAYSHRENIKRLLEGKENKLKL